MTLEQKEQARQEAWRAYRPILAKRHSDFKKKCDEEGRAYLAPEPLSDTAPSWFRTDTGVPDEVPGEWKPESNEVKGPEGLDWLGRVVRQDLGPSPAEVFGDHPPKPPKSMGERVREVVGAQRR